MFGSAILEVVIGLIFVYLLVSLIVTAANELVASALKWRAKTLEKGIRNLLADPEKTGLARDFYEHPLIRGLCEEGKRPSYIPSRTFALALLDIVAKNETGGVQTLADIRAAIHTSQISQSVKEALRALAASVGNDLRQAVSDFSKVQENIEIWFNNSMDRVAGWYKRKAQFWVLILAVIFTGILNIDTILIARTLWTDDIMRAAIVEQAKRIAQTDPSGVQPTPVPDKAKSAKIPVSSSTDEDIIRETKEAKQKLVKSVNNIRESGLPVGWQGERPIPGAFDYPRLWGVINWWWILKVLGLGFTAIAASLGAPFWFDLLNKFITIRSTGKAPEEAPKAPKEVPTPLEPGQLPGLADALKNAVLVVPGGAQGTQQPPSKQP
jgi:hypothetical protein